MKLISSILNGYNKTEKIILAILFAFLWIYLFLRGIYLPLMHDEIGTFYYYIQSGVVFPPDAHYDANNHVLNSLLSHWSYSIFGASPLSLRLPNVLSFAIYFFAIAGIAGRIKDVVFKWSFLSTVTMCFFIFEYFSETRGYGLSLAFLTAAIFNYIRLTETSKARFVIYVGILLWLATCANLTIIISSLLLFVLMATHTVLVDFKNNKKTLLTKFVLMLITGLPFLILVMWSLKLKELGLLYYGSLDGLYPVTVFYLFKYCVGSYALWMGILVGILFWSVVLYLIVKLVREKSLLKWIDGKNILPILFVGSITVIFILAWFMKVNYPKDRAGIYLIIYLAGSVAVVLSALSEKYKLSRIGLIFFAWFPIYFFMNFSLRQALFWVDARHSQPIYDLVMEEESNFKFPLIASGYVTQELCWYYMTHQDGGKQGRLHWSYHPVLDADVQFICPSRFNDVPVRAYYDSLYYDPAADLIYFRRKKQLKKELIYQKEVPSVQNTKAEYYDLIKIENADSLVGETIYLGVEMTLNADAAPFRSRIVAAVDRTEEPRNLAYEFVQLDWLRKSWKGEENNVLQGTLIHYVPEGAETIALYLWNPDTTQFSVTNATSYMYRLERDFDPVYYQNDKD